VPKFGVSDLEDRISKAALPAQGAAAAGRSGLEGEHRYVAALMADIAGSTELTERIGSERWFHLIQEIIQLAWSTIEEFRGTPLNFTGDGIFALFGAPIAVEKASLNACRAAVALQARLEAHAARFQHDHGVSPRLRIGIAGGEVLVVGMNLGSETKPTATGSAVNLAARLQALAPVDGIACSRQIVMDLGDQARFESLGEHAIKGFDGVQTAYRLIGLNGPGATGAAPRRTVFVGRDAPLALVLAWLEAPSAPAICLIHGEAGIGKSRFVEALAGRLAPMRRLLLGSCQVESRARSLAPIIEIFRQATGWKPGNPPEDLAAGLAGITGLSAEEVQPLVEVVGDFAASGDRATPDAALALRRLLSAGLRHLAGRPDLLVLIEDAHWIDPMSRDLLAELQVEGGAGQKLVVTSRSGALLGEGGRPRLLTLPLPPISREDIAAIARARQDDLALPPEVVDLVVAKSEGNPFFATEILKHMAVGGATDLEKLRVGTIQNLLFARFEDLPREVRDLLRIAAVMGRTFRHGVLVRAANATEDEVRRILQHSGELIEPDPGDAAGGGRFVHVLFRDTIFASIPATRRAGMHLDVARAIEATLAEGATTPGGGASEAATLAYHLEAANQPLPALHYLEVAGREALELYALETCDGLMRRAFRIVDQDIGQVPMAQYGRLLEIWARCLELFGKHALTCDVLLARLPHLRLGGVSAPLMVCLTFLAKAMANTAHYDESLALTEEVIDMAETAGDPILLAMGRIVRIKALSDSGKGTLADAQALFAATEGVIDFRRDPQVTLLRMFHMISAARGVGAFREGQRITEELLALARELDSHFLIGAAAWQECLIYFNSDELDKAGAAAATCVRFTLPGTIFNLCGRLGVVRARVQTGQDVAPDTFQGLLEEAERMGEVNLVSSILFTMALHNLLRGRIRDWHRVLQSLRQRPMQGGSIEVRRFIAVFEAEVLMTIAGVLKSTGPKPKLALGDLMFALRLRLTARRRAERLLTVTAAQFTLPGSGAHLARILGDLAILAKARGDLNRARRLGAQAVDFYRAEDCLARADWLQKQVALGVG
jgi:class 3 adenylate cyclase